MTADIYVVALNSKEYGYFLNQSHQELDKELKRKSVRYVHDHRELEMIPPARVFLWGQYFKRPDWPLIEEIIKRRGHRQLLIR